jgi:predicted house-cleaning noncanonical NTP pyrophosphatase (MazG superfamily)
MGWKLVRDKHQETHKKYGVSGSYRTAEEPVKALGKKLFEEAAEFVENYDAGELYDLQDVLQELLKLLDPFGVHMSDHASKVAEHGLFTAHIEWTPVPGQGDE